MAPRERGSVRSGVKDASTPRRAEARAAAVQAPGPRPPRDTCVPRAPPEPQHRAGSGAPEPVNVSLSPPTCPQGRGLQGNPKNPAPGLTRANPHVPAGSAIVAWSSPCSRGNQTTRGFRTARSARQKSLSSREAGIGWPAQAPGVNEGWGPAASRPGKAGPESLRPRAPLSPAYAAPDRVPACAGDGAGGRAPSGTGHPMREELPCPAQSAGGAPVEEGRNSWSPSPCPQPGEGLVWGLRGEHAGCLGSGSDISQGPGCPRGSRGPRDHRYHSKHTHGVQLPPHKTYSCQARGRRAATGARAGWRRGQRRDPDGRGQAAYHNMDGVPGPASR